MTFTNTHTPTELIAALTRNDETGLNFHSVSYSWRTGSVAWPDQGSRTRGNVLMDGDRLTILNDAGVEMFYAYPAKWAHNHWDGRELLLTEDGSTDGRFIRITKV